MLDDVFNNRCYDDLFRRVFEFQQYGDMTNFWIELDYYIVRDKFVSRLGHVLDTEILSFSGDAIFRDAVDRDTIAGRAYKVINETIEPQGDWQDIYKVTELYGYAPSEIYKIYGGEIVQRYGTEDESGRTSQECYAGNRSTYDAGIDIFWIDMDTRISTFNVGDVVNCVGRGSGNFYDFSSAQVSIEAISGYKMKVKAFEIVFNTSGLSIGKQDTMNVINRLNRNYWNGTIYMERQFSARAPGNRFANVRSQITYHDSLPGTIEKFTPVNGTGAEVDTISSTTTPSISVWKNRIAANDEYVVQDSEIVKIHTLYKRTVKYSNCK